MAWFTFGKKDSGKVRTTQAPVQSIEAMRQRAKHRLIGTAVLVLAGVVGFPMLFDSQPRPVSVDVPIEIPDKAKVRPLAPPPLSGLPAAPGARIEDSASLGGKEEIVTGKPAAPKKDEKPANASADTAQAATKSVAPGVAAGVATGAAVAAAAAGALVAKEAAKTPADEAAKAKAVEAKAAEAAKDKEARAKEALATKVANDKAAKDKEAKDKETARAKALLGGDAAKTEAKVAAATPAAQAAGDTRYIVQFGAFAEADKAQEARQKVEKVGLKTYSQVTETAQGKRIRVRVGPFASRDEADKAAAKIKATGLPASILTL